MERQALLERLNAAVRLETADQAAVAIQADDMPWCAVEVRPGGVWYDFHGYGVIVYVSAEGMRTINEDQGGHYMATTTIPDPRI